MYEFLENKTVALVGPAASISGTGKGEYIDQHDFVVRLNYANIASVNDSGARTDIVYYDGSYHDYRFCNPTVLICSYPETEWFFESRCRTNVQFFKNKYDHYVVDSGLYKSLKTSLNEDNKVRPNSGTIAIADLLTTKLSRLYITGIDFYRTSYLTTHPDYGSKTLEEVKDVFRRGDNGDYHDVDIQFEYFKSHLLKDPRIELDDFLKSII